MKHFDTNDKIGQLAMNLKAVLRFLGDVNSLPYKTQVLEDNIELALQQIVQTTSFLRDYYSHGFIGMFGFSSNLFVVSRT